MKSQHHSFDIHIAAEYGLEEAIIIHHFQHWIEVNKNLNRNLKDGKTWTYQTYKEIAAHFPYWTEDQVRDIIESLCTGKNRKSKKEGHFEPVLIKRNYNKLKMDKTNWYAFKNEEKFTKGEIPSREGKSPNAKREIPKAIPDTKTNTKPPPPTPSQTKPKPQKKEEGGLKADENINAVLDLIPHLKFTISRQDVFTLCKRYNPQTVGEQITKLNKRSLTGIKDFFLLLDKKCKEAYDYQDFKNQKGSK